jgi:hypothetical protein
MEGTRTAYRRGQCIVDGNAKDHAVQFSQDRDEGAIVTIRRAGILAADMPVLQFEVGYSPRVEMEAFAMHYCQLVELSQVVAHGAHLTFRMLHRLPDD